MTIGHYQYWLFPISEEDGRKLPNYVELIEFFAGIYADGAKVYWDFSKEDLYGAETEACLGHIIQRSFVRSRWQLDETIYQLLTTTPPDQQTEMEELINDELLEIIDDDHRWGVTEDDLQRMVDKIEQLQQELQPKIDSLIAAGNQAESSGSTV